MSKNIVTIESTLKLGNTSMPCSIELSRAQVETALKELNAPAQTWHNALVLVLDKHPSGPGSSADVAVADIVVVGGVVVKNRFGASS